MQFQTLTYLSRLLHEANVRDSSIFGIIDQLNTLGNVMDNAISHGRSLENKGTEPKVIGLQIKSRVARWFVNEFPVLEAELRNLEDPDINRFLSSMPRYARLQDRLENEQTTFSHVVQTLDNLPDLLVATDDRFADVVQNVKAKYDYFVKNLRQLSNSNIKDDNDLGPAYGGPSDEDLAAQNRQADALVDQILSGMPAAVADEIRRRLPKSGSKLQALNRIMKEVGVQ